MKILLLTTHFNTGGISSYILTLARGFKQSGHQVFVATSGGNLVGELERLGIFHLTLNIRTKSELDPRLYAAALKLKRFIKEEGIEMIHANTRVTQVMGQLLSKSTACGYVSTAHGFFKPKWSRRLFQCWGQFVIAISQPVRQHLIQDLKVFEPKVILIRNGIDMEQFPLVTDDIRKKSRLEFELGEGPVIGMIARLSDVKGHKVLIDAMPAVVQEFPAVKLLIIGEGPMELILRKQVENLSLTKQVRFFPIVNQTSRMLSLLDCFVMPSLQEGLGLAVMEAQACGLPVVASKVGGLLDLIVDGRTGLLVPPANSQILAESLLLLLRHPKQAQEMGIRARTFIAREFLAQSMAEQTLKLYQRTLHLKL